MTRGILSPWDMWVNFTNVLMGSTETAFSSWLLGHEVHGERYDNWVHELMEMDGDDYEIFHYGFHEVDPEIFHYLRSDQTLELPIEPSTPDEEAFLKWVKKTTRQCKVGARRSYKGTVDADHDKLRFHQVQLENYSHLEATQTMNQRTLSRKMNKDWVLKTVRTVKSDADEAYKHPVIVQMVMDFCSGGLGDAEPQEMNGFYLRPAAGFIVID
ncbi:hypothetical protein F4808DRAFT_465904 [Astrocystis sublimbata]|nr:hypothetical protein F4808DRAFT_465904 [Astrocystis sublimbata]